MSREVQVRIREKLGVKFPGPTRQTRHFDRRPTTTGLSLETDIVRAGRHVSKVPKTEIQAWNRDVRLALMNGRNALRPSGPKSARRRPKQLARQS